jgi:hypothetical protein
MKLRALTTATVLGAMALVQPAAASRSSSQTDLNTQLEQALCAQNWGRAFQIIDRMKSAAGPEYASQLTLYRGQLEVIARENVNVCAGTQAAGGGDRSQPTTPASNPPSIISPNSSPVIPTTSQPMTFPNSGK